MGTKIHYFMKLILKVFGLLFVEEYKYNIFLFLDVDFISLARFSNCSINQPINYFLIIFKKMAKKLTQEDVTPNSDLFEESGFLLIFSLYWMAIAILQVDLCSTVYVIYRTFKKWKSSNSNLSMAYKIPFYIACIGINPDIYLILFLIYIRILLLIAFLPPLRFSQRNFYLYISNYKFGKN